MSTTIIAYLVSAEELRKARGSKDKDLLAALPDLAGFFETIDDIGKSRDDDEEQPPTCAEVFAQIVNGDPLPSEFGYVFGYAYEALCMTLGSQAEPAWHQIAGGSNKWIQEIDNALLSLGIELSVANLVYRGCLFKLPTPDDLPCLGWWSAEEIAEAVLRFEGLDNDNPKWRETDTVKPVLLAIEEIQLWLQQAVVSPGISLIGILS